MGTPADDCCNGGHCGRVLHTIGFQPRARDDPPPAYCAPQKDMQEPAEGTYLPYGAGREASCSRGSLKTLGEASAETMLFKM